MSAELEKCRECVVEQHEEVITALVDNIESNKKRELNVIHTEVRNRIISQQND